MVNVNTYTAEEKPTDVLEKIFEKQRELMDLYWTKPVGEDIDTLKGSQEIRRYSKYTVEELAEAYEAFRNNEAILDIHTHEELIDSLHFYIEKLIISNLTYKKILFYLGLKDSEEFRETVEKVKKVQNTVEESLRLATYYINIPDNRLRNKEWKNEQLPTNRDMFYKENSRWFLYYIVCMNQLWLDQNLLWEYYSRKNKVNHFRINSNY